MGAVKHVNGHRVKRLAGLDSHRYCCLDCAGHADSIDAYRNDACDVPGGDSA